MSDLSKYNGLTLGADISVDVIKSTLNASEARVIAPNTLLDRRYNFTRISIYVDYNNVIQKVAWG